MPLPAFLIAALKAAPLLATAAAKVHETLSKAKPKTAPTEDVRAALDHLREQVERLEANSLQQAELVSQIAAQGEALAQGVSALARRIKLMELSIAGASMVAVTALVVALV